MKIYTGTTWGSCSKLQVCQNSPFQKIIKKINFLVKKKSEKKKEKRKEIRILSDSVI